MTGVRVRGWEIFFLVLCAMVVGGAVGWTIGRAHAKSGGADAEYVKWLQTSAEDTRTAMYRHSEAFYAVCGRFLVPFATDPQANWVVDATERVAQARRANPAWQEACQAAVQESWSKAKMSR